MNLIEQLFNNFNAKYLEEAKARNIDLGLQTVYTPIDKIEKAAGFRFADHINAETKSVAILFNTEFINYFIKELPQDYIKNIKFTFFYDCKFDYMQVQDCIFFSGNKLNIEMISIENIKDLDKVMAGKKFDIVFSNPPYDRSLHLKIINECSNICENIIWISPLRWLQDPMICFNLSNEFERYKNSICEHLEDIITIPFQVSNAIFNISTCDLGIYVWKKNPIKKFNYYALSNNAVNKNCRNILTKFKIGNFFRRTKGFHINKKDKEPGRIQDVVNNWINSIDQNAKYFFFINFVNGGMTGTWQTTKLANYGIFTKDKIFDILINDPAQKMLISFNEDELECAKSLFEMIKNNEEALRFGLAVTQDTQAINSRCYTFFPDIDYSNIKNSKDIYKYFNLSEDEEMEIKKYLNDFDAKKK